MTSKQHQKLLDALPSDWNKAPLAQIGNIQAGGTPSRNEPRFWGGTVPWVTPTDITALKDKWIHVTQECITENGLAKSAATLMPERSLLITSRATLGEAAITLIPMATNQGFKNLALYDGNDEIFYYYIIKLIRGEIRRFASGSTFDEISKKDFEAIIVPRPKFVEQRDIAAILDAADAAIQHTATLIDKLERMKQGLLHDLLTRGLDDNGELRDPEAHPEQFQPSPLGRMPKDWEIKTLGYALDQCGGHVQTGPFGSQLHAYEYTSNGVPVIMPQDIIEGQINEAQIARIPEERAADLARHSVQVNDLVFARRGDLARCAYIGSREQSWICGTGCLLARIPGDSINSYWLAEIYRSPRSQRQILARAVGSTMVNLNTTILQQLVIALPSENEQGRIVDRLQAFDGRLHAEQSRLAKLKRLKEGLMRDLLTGRVRVSSLAQNTALVMPMK